MDLSVSITAEKLGIVGSLSNSLYSIRKYCIRYGNACQDGSCTVECAVRRTFKQSRVSYKTDSGSFARLAWLTKYRNRAIINQEKMDKLTKSKEERS